MLQAHKVTFLADEEITLSELIELLEKKGLVEKVYLNDVTKEVAIEIKEVKRG